MLKPFRSHSFVVNKGVSMGYYSAYSLALRYLYGDEYVDELEEKERSFSESLRRNGSSITTEELREQWRNARQKEQEWKEKNGPPNIW